MVRTACDAGRGGRRHHDRRQARCPELVSPAFDACGVDEFTAPPYAAVRQAILYAGGAEYGFQEPQEYLHRWAGGLSPVPSGWPGVPGGLAAGSVPDRIGSAGDTAGPHGLCPAVVQTRCGPARHRRPSAGSSSAVPSDGVPSGEGCRPTACASTGAAPRPVAPPGGAPGAGSHAPGKRPVERRVQRRSA
ncbi:hypothetical protein F3L20_21105 [Streptomyces tendae]|uniref:Uncharacterized protein n=1 Tax=Streptomyces tendae TaxID=1932 RepID=A0ABX5ZU93_STRTE|nr:hypothetical protein F3L20_21105 [Streptomyces tendae]